MKQINFGDLLKGVPFVVVESWCDVFIKFGDGVYIIASRNPYQRLGLTKSFEGVARGNTVYEIDPADIPFRTQVDKSKFEVGDRVLVVAEGYEWGNVLVKDSIAVIDEVLPDDKYDVTGVVKDKTVPLSSCKQFAVEARQLKKI